MSHKKAPPSSPATNRTKQVPGAVAAGTTLTVPVYVVGKKKLTVHLNNILCDEGEAGFYLEQGVAGANSTTIKLNDALEAGWEITAVVAG